jgi:hypothetical protein
VVGEAGKGEGGCGPPWSGVCPFTGTMHHQEQERVASVAHGALEALGVLQHLPTKASPAASAAVTVAGDAELARQLHSYWHLEAALSASLASALGAGSVTSMGERLHVQHSVATQRLYRAVFAQPGARKALAAVRAAEGDGDASVVRFGGYMQQVVALHASGKGSPTLDGAAAVNVSVEALAAIEARQQQHDTDIELLMTEVCGLCMGWKGTHPPLALLLCQATPA